ncbi:MAG: FG-GAP-like repeat-containing protein [Verrucomicrobiales bacterium]
MRLYLLLLFVIPALGSSGFLHLSSRAAEQTDGNRFAYLAEDDPYYPDGDFPKLTTPMWIGEDDVDAAICLTIDDMCRMFPEGKRPKGLPSYARRPQVYYDFLKPAIDRLRQIDGRAPVTVFSLQLDADDRLVRHMQELGLTMECHTWTHPVPLLRTVKDPPPPPPESLQPAVEDTLKTLTNLAKLAGPAPVAQRNPGCDARNTASPRMFSEIFPMRTAKGHFLRMDSSIFLAFTKTQPGMPREWFFHEDGRKRFVKFIHGIPFTETYRNYVTDYPYPFVINRTLWELPAAIPGDAHGVHAYGNKSEEILEDWKRALDVAVAMKGVYTLCFHPHGYVRSDQIAALVDYADRTYGGRVKFLNCREVYDRLTRHLCAGVPLREAEGDDGGVRLADVNADGHLDVLLGPRSKTRIWNPETGHFRSLPLPTADFPFRCHLFNATLDGRAGLALAGEKGFDGAWVFRDGGWQPVEFAFSGKADLSLVSGGYRFRDVNGDGLSDLIVNHAEANAIYLREGNEEPFSFREAPFALPRSGMLVDAEGKDGGLRFVDLDDDGDHDLIHSDERDYGVWRFEDSETGWAPVREGDADDPDRIPAIVENGRNFGVWFHSGEMIQANEFTAELPDGIARRTFAELLEEPGE